MTQLFINSLPAVLPSGASFKLTRENPALTDSGDHTLEVTLPLLDCPQNQAIFGLAHRTDISHVALASSRMPFLLAADELLIQGEAVVTNITDSDVKVQLIGGRSYLNLQSRDSEALDRYIDELDLGRAWDSVYPFNRAETYPTSVGKLMMHLSYPTPLGLTQEQRNKLRWGTVEDTPCVIFPIFSKADGEFANAFTYNDFGPQDVYSSDYYSGNCREWNSSAPVSFPGFPLLGEYRVSAGGRQAFLTYAGEDTTWRLHTSNVLAPQPYLCFIVERILSAVGFTLTAADNCLRSGTFAKLFIANARGTLYYNQMLPHWTVREFLTEVQRICGVWFDVQAQTVRIRPVADLAAGNLQVITGVVDERTIEVTSDTAQKSTAAASVVYAFDDAAPAVFLPDEIFEKAAIVEVDNITDIPARVSVEDEDDARLYYSRLYYVRSTDRYYAYFAPSTSSGASRAYRQEVNQMGALHRTPQHNNDADIQLRIVPAGMTDLSVRWHVFLKESPGSNDYRLQQLWNGTTSESEFLDTDGQDYISLTVLQTTMSRGVGGYDPINIQQELIDAAAEDTDPSDPTSDDNPKPQILEVALNDTVIAGTPSLIMGQQLRYNPAGESTEFHPRNGYNRPDSVNAHEGWAPRAVGNPYVPYNGTPGAYYAAYNRYFDLHYSATDRDTVRKNLDAAIAADTRVKHQIDFTDRTPFDPSLPFIIGGRRFVCERLEYSIDDHGVQSLRRGYFYEVDE